MTPRFLSTLAAASLIAVAAAGYVVSQESGFQTATVNSKVFPDLRDKLNDVTQLKMVNANRQMTLLRKDNTWSMVESDGYPAEVKNIQKVLIGLSDLVYAEAKTKKPELYEKLDLREPTIKQSRGRWVSVLGADGELLVDVILGKTRYNMPGTTRDGIYFRFPGADQAWLAIGQLEASKLPSDWLKTRIVNIAEKKIKIATFRHPDGETLTVQKASENDQEFELLDLPADKKLKYKTDPKNMATVLDELELDDVRKASHFDFSDTKTIKASFQTFDGLTVNVQIIELKEPAAEEDEEDESVYWAQVSAQADGNGEAAQTAKEISDHTQGWAFKLPAFKASRMNKRLKDILTDKKTAS